jgi:hypothetical protein
MEGWISIHRKIKDNWIWDDKPFSKGQAWIDILLRVNHADNKILIGNQLIEVKRGQTIWSILDMSEAWGWSKTKVSNFLKLLENENNIEQKRTTKYTLITVAKWDMYQSVELEKRNKTESKEKQKNTNNNVNNENKKHEELFDYYSTLGLVKHRTLTGEMVKAMDKATKELNCDFDYLKVLLDRHKVEYEKTKDTDFKIKPRSIVEFFGQKVYGGTSLICSKYDYYEQKPKQSIDTSTLGERVTMWND